MFLYLVRPESSRIFCCKVYKWVGVVFRWFYFPGVFCESIVFTEVRQRSRVLSVGGGRDYSSVTEVTSKVLAEAVLIEVWQKEVMWISGKRPSLYRSDRGQVYLQA